MNKVLIVLSCLASVAFAQWGCPPSGCPPPTRPPNCGIPDCSILSNRYHENALFPHVDPTMYWQCAPLNATHWAALERHCACSTVFNPFIVNGPPRCSFWWEEGWFADPVCGWTSPPRVRECVPDCPTCNGPTTPSPWTTTTQGLEVTPPNGQPPSDNCPCPCPPCIWWPCSPCTPQLNCACNQMRG